MKHIKRFNEIYNLENEEDLQKVDEGWKEMIIAGALSLASIGTFGQQKTALNLPSGKQYSTNINKKDTTVTVNLGNQFKSAEYQFDKEKSDDLEAKLGQIAEFIKNQPNKNISIKINSGESLVPNRDIETKKRLPKGALANKRSEVTKDLINNLINSLKEKGKFSGSYNIDTSTTIGKTPFVPGEDPQQDKFKKEQFVNVTVLAQGEVSSQSIEYADYARFNERIYVDGKAVGDIFVKSRETTNIKDAGNVDTGKEYVLLKTLSKESDYASTKNKYDGNMYLIPSDWWNKNVGSNTISQSLYNDIKSSFKVTPQ